MIFSCAELTEFWGRFWCCRSSKSVHVQIWDVMEAGMKQSSSFFLFDSCCQAVKNSDCLGTTDLFSAQQKQGFSGMFSITLMEMTHVTSTRFC